MRVAAREVSLRRSEALCRLSAECVDAMITFRCEGVCVFRVTYSTQLLLMHSRNRGVHGVRFDEN